MMNELNFESIFTITSMLEKIEIDKIIEDLEEKLTKMQEDYNKLIKNSDDKEELEKKYKEERKTFLGKELLKAVIKKPHLVKDEIYELVGQYTDKTVDEVKKMSLKLVLTTFKDMIKNGLIDCIKEAMGEDAINNLKKTL